MTCLTMCASATFGGVMSELNHIYTFIAPKNGPKQSAVWSDIVGGTVPNTVLTDSLGFGRFGAWIARDQKQ
ncbi:hypothetical protein [Roseovarius phycicola]|uniref:Uncharacterized protein n=1 Tax=Roseovarius phycicola TaxID=3080976 RepID=A0ABZ2HEU6_9RHOB